MVYRLFTLIVLSLFAKIGVSQIHNANSSESNNYSLLFSYQNGYVFPTNNFVKGINAENDTINAFQTISLKLTKQTIGKKLWEQLYNYPEYGLGLYLADFHNPEEIGLPIALYGYFTAPFQRWNRFIINYELGFGIAFNWKHFGPSDLYNTAIGSRNTVYIDLGMKSEYQLNNKVALGLGFSVTHFSNGRLKSPNFGLNTIAPKVSLKYSLYKNDIQFIKQDIPKYKKHNELLLSAFTGAKNILYDSLNIAPSEKFEGESFYVFGLISVFHRQISYKSKIGFGISLSYDGSVNAQIAIENGKIDVENGPLLDKIQMSIFPSYSLVVNKVSVILQPSFYIYRKHLNNQSPVFYQRIGINYNFYKKYYAGLNLRAYQYHVSDFIEWNIGYRFN